MATQIITPTEFKALRDLGFKVDTDKSTEAIREAQQVELYDVLGDFVFDVIANKDIAGYTDLMDGSTFTVGTENFIHEGIKSLLADFAFARYLSKTQVNLAPFGAVIKTSEDSEPVSKEVIDEMITKTRQDASVKMIMIKLYLRENSSTFSRYVVGGADVQSIGSRRYTIIK